MIRVELCWEETGTPEVNIPSANIVEYGRVTERHAHLLGITVPQVTLEIKHQQTKQMPPPNYTWSCSNNCHCDIIMRVDYGRGRHGDPLNLQFQKAQCISSSAA